MAASVVVAFVVSLTLGATVDVLIALPAVITTFVVDSFLVRIVANAVAVAVSIAGSILVSVAVSVTVAITVSITVVNIVVTTVATVVTAIVPVSATRMVLMNHVVLRVKSKEEQVGHRREVLGGDASKFVFETGFKIMLGLRIPCAKQDPDRESCRERAAFSYGSGPLCLCRRGLELSGSLHWSLLRPA